LNGADRKHKLFKRESELDLIMRHLVRILGINRRILTFILLLLIKLMIIEGAIKVWKINCEDMNWFEVDAFLLVVLTL
jgi:hypothetical protein